MELLWEDHVAEDDQFYTKLDTSTAELFAASINRVIEVILDTFKVI